MALPASWTDALDRLARILGDGDAYRQEAEEWLRQAVKATYGADSLHDLARSERLVAFQKTCGVVLLAEEEGVPDELYDGTLSRVLWVLFRDGTLAPAEGEPSRRERVARFFSRYFVGVALDGPPWRLSLLESDRPTYEQWIASSEFG